jgi:hypothetical protein
MNDIVWLNTNEYSNTELFFFFAGAICWIAAYAFIIKDIYKNKYVGIPVGVVGADIAWEFLWTFVFKHNMGFLLQLGYYAWFVLDLIIVWNTFRYGYKQVHTDMQKYFKLLFGFSIFAWLVVLYFFIENGYDNAIGANSAFIIQLVISFTYLMLLLRIDKFRGKLNVSISWLRMFGSLLIGVMCIMHWPQNTWITSMVVIFMMIDIFFLVLMYRKLERV